LEKHNWYKCKNGIFLVADNILWKPLFVFELFTISDVNGTSLVKFCFRAATTTGVKTHCKKLIA